MRSCLKLLTFSLALAVTSALSIPAALAQSTVNISVNQTASSSCPSGEPVALTGNLHFTYSFTTDPVTLINAYQINVSSGVSGIGQSTQTNYAGGASFGYNLSTTNSPAQFTAQLSYGLNSQGSAPSLTLNQTVNITVDTSGNISASVANSSTQCAN